MRYESYLQWRSKVTAMIAAKMDEMRPRPSDNVTVLDQAIGVAPLQVEPEPTPEPTWEYLLKGSIVRDAGELIVPEMTAARFPRSGVIIQDSLFWGQTQLNGVPSLNPVNYQKTLTFRMTSTDQFDSVTGLGIYRGGLVLNLELYVDVIGLPQTVVDRYRIAVGSNPVSRQFTPPGELLYRLRIESVERL